MYHVCVACKFIKLRKNLFPFLSTVNICPWQNSKQLDIKINVHLKYNVKVNRNDSTIILIWPYWKWNIFLKRLIISISPISVKQIITLLSWSENNETINGSYDSIVQDISHNEKEITQNLWVVYDKVCHVLHRNDGKCWRLWSKGALYTLTSRKYFFLKLHFFSV